MPFRNSGAATGWPCVDPEREPVPVPKFHFGYTDGISQVTITGGPEHYAPDHQEPCEPWLFVLLDEAENYYMPDPRNWGAMAVSALHNDPADVVGFEQFLQDNKDRIDPELLAAKICGRWRNGVPLVLSPDTETPPEGIPRATEQLRVREQGRVG